MPIYKDPLDIEVTNKVDVKDMDARGLLLEILHEFKKANLYLYLLTNEEIEDDDY